MEHLRHKKYTIYKKGIVIIVCGQTSISVNMLLLYIYSTLSKCFMFVIGQSTNPLVIQTHLKKLFAGIHTVQFDDGNQHILAMKSVDGEVVMLKTPVKIQPEVEVLKYTKLVVVSS